MPSTAIRAILVDDEPIARKILREELEPLSDITIVGEAENGHQAIDQIHSLKPDLVFLDLQMPGMDGFEVVRQLDVSPLPCIVIVTAYDQHAIRAFEAGAVDYLLKPVREERLARCLQRVRDLRKSALAVAQSIARLHEFLPIPRSETPRKIVGKLGQDYFLLEGSDVLAFQAERELVWIITPTQRYLATEPLKTLEQKLGGLNFTRIHRNCLINMTRVAKVTPFTSKRWIVTMDNQQAFTVSRRRACLVQRLLRW